MDQARPKLTIAMCAAMHGIGGGLGWSLLPPLMPTIAKDLSISHSMGGIVWGSASLGIALASPFGGAAVDRFGPRRVAGFAMLAGALACAARAFVGNAWTLGVAMFAFGLHIGFVAPAIPKALVSHVPLARLGRANGIAILSYTLGTALTVLTARTVLAPALGGWRNAMGAAAVAMTGVAVAWFFLVRDRVALSPHASLREVFALVRNRNLMRIAVMHWLLFGGYLSLLGILPRALAETGMPVKSIGVAIASWLLTAAAANLAGPWLSDRIGRRRPIILVGAVLAGGALAVVALSPPGNAAWGLAAAALGGGSFAPLLFAMPLEMREIGPAKAGAALGLLSLVGQFGGFVLPIATGAVAQAGSFPAAIGLLALVHLAIVIPALRLREPNENASAPGLTPELVA